MSEIPLQLYVGGSLFLYFLIGIKVYLFDLWIGIPIRMFFYRLFHKEELAENKRFGFVHRRSGRSKLFLAGVIAFVTSIIFMFTMETNPIVEVATYFFDATFVFLGFLAGPWAHRTIKGKNKVLEVLDASHEKVVSGELMSDTREALRDFSGKAAEMIDEGAEHLTGTRPLGTRDKAAEPVVPTPATSDVPASPPVILTPLQQLEAARKKITDFTS
jgi:hypothetical protein